MNKSKKLINTINILESRAAKWLLAVDEDIYRLQSYLEHLGYKVIYFGSGKKDSEINKLLLEKGVNFFITKNGKHFEEYVKDINAPKKQYSLIWVEDNVTSDLEILAKIIEKAIMYDRELRGDRPGVRKITGYYITKSAILKSKADQAKKR